MRGLRAGVLLAVGAVGCPRTPPRVDFEGGVHVEPQAVDVPPADVPRFAVVTSAQVPGEGRTLTVGSLTLAAEPAERFIASLALPVVGSVAETWVYRVGINGEALDLLRVVAEAGALRREVIAGTAPSTPNCISASLRATSPRSVVVTARCGARAESRWVSRGNAPRTRSVVVVEAAPAGTAEVTAEVTAEDRDQDDADELRIAVRPADIAGSAPEARLVYIDRSGVLSRDVAEPAQSLTSASQSARQTAMRRTTSVRALEAERGIGALRRALCVEEGAARIIVDGARGVSCGAAGGVRDRARIRVAAMLGLGELPAAEQIARALAAMPEHASAWAELEADLRSATTTDRGWRARTGPFVGMPLDTSAPGRVGSIAFDLPLRPPAVMVRGLQGGRVDMASLAFVPGAAGSARELLATIPGVGVVVGVGSRCDGVSLLLCDPAQPCEPVPAGAAATPPGLTRWPAHTYASVDPGGACATNPEAMRVLGPPSTQVMGAQRDRVLVSIEGRLWWVGAARSTAVLMSQRLGAGFSPGGPVSVNGAWAVLPGLNGLWVRGATGWKLRPVEGLEGRTAQLRDLVISDDGAVIAGLLGTQLQVIERRPPR